MWWRGILRHRQIISPARRNPELCNVHNRVLTSSSSHAAHASTPYTTSMTSLDLSNIAAPMVNQSDLPFRILVRRYTTSLVYTQMLLPDRLLSDQEYLEFHRRGLRDVQDTPVVVQLCGNDPETVVRAARTVVDRADAIGACNRAAERKDPDHGFEGV